MTENKYFALAMAILSFLLGLGATTGQILIVSNDNYAMLIGIVMFVIGGVWLNKYLKADK